MRMESGTVVSGTYEQTYGPLSLNASSFPRGTVAVSESLTCSTPRGLFTTGVIPSSDIAQT